MKKNLLSLLFALTVLLVSCALQTKRRVIAATALEKKAPTFSSSNNVREGIGDLEKIGTYISIYREKNNGIYPTTMDKLLGAMMNHPEDYGFKSFVEVARSLANPDSAFADNPSYRLSPNNTIPYIIVNKRPDGSPINGVKLSGTKDIFAFAYLYVHGGEIHLPNNRVVLNPSGYFIVLWDDGTVNKIPYDSVFSLQETAKMFSTTFPQQAGVAGVALVDYGEAATYVGRAKFPPIGKPIPAGKDEPIPDNGGPESLIHLSRLMSVPNLYGVEREKMWALLNPAQPEFALSEIQVAAGKLELPLQVKKATLDELAQFGAPAILFLQDDKRQVVLAGISDKYAMVIDRGITRIVSRETLSNRYSGEALLPQAALDKPANLRTQDGLQQVTVTDIKKEIPVQAILKNSGATPLQLQIEQPIPGCLKAQLSSDTIAPGAQATLTATVKWRDVMKTMTQNVVIWIKSNDPARPRLPIGVRLALPKPPTAL